MIMEPTIYPERHIMEPTIYPERHPMIMEPTIYPERHPMIINPPIPPYGTRAGTQPPPLWDPGRDPGPPIPLFPPY